MLQEVKDLQDNAVSRLVEKVAKKEETTFRAPTGSGKTRMMADMMNRIIEANENIIFLVSSLSKGDLAKQDYESFKETADDGTFPKLNPYLISTDISGEEGLQIPDGYNVYVLPRDLFKEDSLLMRGPMINFLRTMTGDIFGEGKNKIIYLVKDECHQATSNIDTKLKGFFRKVINFSATPDKKKGQIPDVMITDSEAEDACLIKRVEFGSLNDTVEDAIKKFKEVKQQYISLDVEPCLIIQISNKGKAEQEWNENIRPVLDKVENQGLKWMVMVDLKGKKGEASLCDTNDIIKGKLPVIQWKDYAKNRGIDVIIFKMVISEGWDIPRACMLYQVRDSQSKQLDEQVLGRVRRNPRLLDFETLNDEQKRLATTAWVWGIRPDTMMARRQVSLFGGGSDIQDHFKVKSTRLENLTQKADFDIEGFIDGQLDKLEYTSIFELHKKLSRVPNDLQTLCYDYSREDIQRWYKFVENIDKVKAKYDNYICDYDKSVVVDKEVTFPVTSSFTETSHEEQGLNWVWSRKDGKDKFAFDSYAEKEWAAKLRQLASKRNYISELEMPGMDEEDELFLWGKNYPLNSEIKYEYYANGIHASYPDFVMKDKLGRIHIFEVKSVNVAVGTTISKEEYEKKVKDLHDLYIACSKKLPDYRFYLPIMKDDDWRIRRYYSGVFREISYEEFRKSLKEQDL